MRVGMLLAALSTVAGCAINPPPSEPVGAPEQLVDFADLNLADPSAVRVLYERIETAAVQVCGSVRAHDVAQLWVRPCVHRAIERAVSKVNKAHARADGFVLDARAARAMRAAEGA